MRHGWSAQHTSQHSTSDLRVARTRSARRPGSDAMRAPRQRFMQPLHLRFWALGRARRGTRPAAAEAIVEHSVGPRGAGADRRKSYGAASSISMSRWTSQALRAQRCTKGTH